MVSTKKTFVFNGERMLSPGFMNKAHSLPSLVFNITLRSSTSRRDLKKKSKV